MPNRVIKESIKRSPQIDALTWFEEVVFYRILVTADDYGCMEGRTILVKNELFPSKDSVTKKSMEDALSKLISVGLIRMYEVEGIPYIYLPTWDKHQRVRNKRRKFPEPPEFDGCSTIGANLTATCGHAPASGGYNPIQSESESISESEPRASAFDVFWEAYPKKSGKGDARKAFAKVKVPLETLLKAIEDQKRSVQWQKDGGQYIPNPSTWLNQGRWEDELPTNTPKIGFNHEEAKNDDLTLLRQQLGMGV